MKSIIITVCILLFIVGLAAGGTWYWMHSNKPPMFRTAAVQRGEQQTRGCFWCNAVANGTEIGRPKGQA